MRIMRPSPGKEVGRTNAAAMLKRALWLLWLLCGLALAKPYIPELIDVPTDKLLARLDKLAAARPKDAHTRYLLARVHAIAYAQKTATFQVAKNDPDRPYFGPFDPGFPPEHGASAGAKKHLELALQQYRLAIELDPSSQASRMGLAWCLEESGQRARAVEQYRKVYQTALKDAPKVNFGVGMAEEAGRRLLALLNPKKDAAEIASIRKELARLEAQPRAVTPVLIPLEREHEFSQLVDERAGVRFDLDGSGRHLAWGWPTPRAGWLVYLDRLDRVDSALQLFGGVSWWVFWENGYEAMGALDQDGDRWLEGPELEHIRVWCDRDQDGVFQASEVVTLGELGIQALSTVYRTHRLGFPYSPYGIRYEDGGLGPSYDWMPEGIRAEP